MNEVAFGVVSGKLLDVVGRFQGFEIEFVVRLYRPIIDGVFVVFGIVGVFFVLCEIYVSLIKESVMRNMRRTINRWCVNLMVDVSPGLSMMMLEMSCDLRGLAIFSIALRLCMIVEKSVEENENSGLR